MKHWKITLALILGLASCMQEEVLAPKVFMGDSDEVIVFEEASPRAKGYQQRDLRGLGGDTESAIEWYKNHNDLAWLGRTYWFKGEDSLASELKKRLIDVQSLMEDREVQDNISVTNERKDSIGYYITRDYRNLRKENRRYQKIGGGFKLSLFGLKLLGVSSSHEKTFYSLRESFDTALWGECNIVHSRSSVEMHDGLLLRANIIERHLASGFTRELYSAPIGEICDGYGPLVLSKYILGGKLSAKYMYQNHEKIEADTAYSTFTANVSLSFSPIKKTAGKDSLSGGEGAQDSVGVNYQRSVYKFDYSKLDLKKMYMAVHTIGGTPSIGLNIPVMTVEELKTGGLDLGPWYTSLADASTHTLLDVKDGGLLPISEFILENNFKRRIMDVYAGVLERNTTNMIPELEIRKVYVRSDSQGKPLCDVALVLKTRNDDRVILTRLDEQASDETLRGYDERSLFTQRGKELLKQMDGMFVGLKKLGRTKVLYPYLRTTLCTEAIVDFKNMYRYKNPLNKVVYLYDSKAKIAFSYYDGDEGDETQVEVYGLATWASTLPEKKISMLNLLQNYKVIGL